METFIALWKHRYHKYSEIFKTYWAFWKTYAWIKWLKLTKGKPVIAILQAEHMGDIVTGEPIARKIRNQHPEAILCWIVKKPFRELLDYNPAINHIILEPNVLFSCLLVDHSPFDKLYNFHLSNRVYEPLKRRLVNAHADSIHLTIHNFLEFGRLTEVFATAANVPLPSPADGPKLYIPNTAKAKVDSLNLPEKYVVLHTISNQLPKDWVQERWNDLANRLLKDFGPVVEIGLVPNVQNVSKDFYNLCGKLSVLESAEVIRRATFFIGLDSGPAHMANAVGTYGFILLGKHGPFEHYDLYTGGYGDGSNARMIRSQRGTYVPSLTVEEVWQPIEEYLIGRKMAEAFTRPK
ncbi:MAG: glycosyltransferase family 9 protein [Siphonobacter sp.]